MAEVTKPVPKLELIRASQIDPISVEWLWYPFIPYGKVTLVQGDPGDGKSTFLLTIAAMLTRGDPLPFTEPERQEINPKKNCADFAEYDACDYESAKRNLNKSTARDLFPENINETFRFRTV